MQTALILCRFVHFCVVLVLFGLCLSRDLMLRGHFPADASGPLDRRLHHSARWLAFIALVSAVAWLLLISASMAGSWQDGVTVDTLWLVLGNTFFGKVWSWHLLISALLVMLLARSAPVEPRLRLILGALLLATLAPVGHGAMFDGLQGQLLILNQLIHLVAVGAWLGGLMLLLLTLSCPDSINLRGLLMGFSGVGYFMVAIIIMTGLINVRALSGSAWPTPAFTGFGLVLSIKVALVLCMLALALFNRLMLQRNNHRLEILRASISLECLFGLGAVAAVSLLGTLPPMLLT
jgi:putative copper resistance protein D